MITERTRIPQKNPHAVKEKLFCVGTIFRSVLVSLSDADHARASGWKCLSQEPFEWPTEDQRRIARFRDFFAGSPMRDELSDRVNRSDPRDQRAGMDLR